MKFGATQYNNNNNTSFFFFFSPYVPSQRCSVTKIFVLTEGNVALLCKARSDKDAFNEKKTKPNKKTVLISSKIRLFREPGSEMKVWRSG